MVRVYNVFKNPKSAFPGVETYKFINKDGIVS